MSEKKDVRMQVKISRDAHLTLCKLKCELYGKNFSETIQESYHQIHHLQRVYKEVNDMNREYGDIIHNLLNDRPLTYTQNELIKHWISKPKEIEN